LINIFRVNKHKKLEISAIDRVVNIIRSEADPDRIIMFGSRVREDFTDNSDYDFLILKNGLKDERSLTTSLYKAFYSNKIGVPIDLLALDTEKYNQLKETVGYIYKTINEEGKVIYERT